MIVDLEQFIAEGRLRWQELETFLVRLEKDAGLRLEMEEIVRFHQLYQRASADLARFGGLAAEPELRHYLEALVARAFGEIHEIRRRPHRVAPIAWFFRHFPRAFRRHLPAFHLAIAATLLGGAIAVALMVLDPEAKEALLPFAHLQGDPAERVAAEERQGTESLAGSGGEQGERATFSSYLVTHNTRVAILSFALGATFGIGTFVLLFYNGAILGAVIFDYLRAGEGIFLAGWLLPHGMVEIPAFLIAGQAGLALAGALIGRGRGLPLADRLREVSGDLALLIGGVAVLLAWAALVESFVSQHHQPVLPYGLKIGLGAAELILLLLLLGRGGRSPEEDERA